MRTLRKADLKWRHMAPGMTPKLSEMFERRMLREGRTVKDLTNRNSKSYLVPESRYKVHRSLDSAWAKRVSELNKANISRKKRDSSGHRAAAQKYCLKGLHRMTGDNVMIVNAIGHRRCRICHYAAAAGHPMPVEKVEEIKAAVANGATFNQICHGIPAGGGEIDRSLVITTAAKLQRQRRLAPELDAFLTKHFEANSFIGQLLRHNKDASEEMKMTLRLIGKIRHKVKASGRNCLAFTSKDQEVDDECAFSITLLNNIGSLPLEGARPTRNITNRSMSHHWRLRRHAGGPQSAYKFGLCEQVVRATFSRPCGTRY